jgi:N-acylneuraminate cytidylyltransferase
VLSDIKLIVYSFDEVMTDNRVIFSEDGMESVMVSRADGQRLLRKNIRLLSGKPLIDWTIEDGEKSKYIDSLILSSEDEEIIDIAKKWRCEVPFVRHLE